MHNRRNYRNQFLTLSTSNITIVCNDLFSRFEQQILILEKLSWSTDRRGCLVPKYLEFWKLGTEIDSLNFVTGRTVTGMMGRHRLFSKFQSLNSVTEAAGRTVAVTTSRHRLRNPRLSRIFLNVLRDVLDYSCFNYKFSGLILITQLLGG